MAKNNVAEFTLQLKENRYKGETYHQLVGSFRHGTRDILISINCDSSGNIKFYESKRGNQFCYVRAIGYNKQNRTRRNQIV